VTIRSALFLGFSLTFGVWLAAGYYFSKRIEDLEASTAIMSGRYVRAQHQLTAARAQILLGAVYLRDALLDPAPANAAGYRHQVEAAYESATKALQEYEPVVDSESERERVERLQRQIEDFRVTMFDVLATDTGRSLAEASALLRNRVMPQREAANDIVEELQNLNRDAFVQQEAKTAALYRAMQRRIWQILGLALTAGIGIAVFATLYAGRLEHDLRLEQAKDAQTSLDLQRLSAKLTTAQEEERRTIARELHDEVGQLLTAIKMELAAAQRAIQAEGGSPELLQDARLIADGTLHTVRELSRMLHPSLLDDLGLTTAVDVYLKGFGKRHELRAALSHEGMQERLSSDTEVAAYRIIQEALTNIAKHAHATECAVVLQRLSASVLITVEDNGTGFDVAEQEQPGARRGLGLIGIRERVSQLDGAIRVESAPGRGTKLTIELPAAPRATPETAGSPASAAIRVGAPILHG